MFHKLGNETERFLDGDTANEGDDVRVVALGYLLHRINLVEKVGSLATSGTCCNETEKPLSTNMVLPH